MMRRRPALLDHSGGARVRVTAALWLQHDLDVKGQPFLISGDAEGYWELGRRIANGEPYELYGRHVLRMPGYPAFVAGSIGLARVLRIPDKDHLLARLLMAGVGTLDVRPGCPFGESCR